MDFYLKLCKAESGKAQIGTCNQCHIAQRFRQRARNTTVTIMRVQGSRGGRTQSAITDSGIVRAGFESR
eukprot:scaffold91748_cov14-Prasinocladus_malaysianus.AAC.1